jgi:hypothetical protein
MTRSEDAVYREEVKRRYGFAGWAGARRRSEAGLCLGFIIPVRELRNLALEETEKLPPVSRERRAVRFIYRGAGARAVERAVVLAQECDSLIDAHEALIDLVMTYMAPSLPRCVSFGLAIGDICFGSHGKPQMSLLFSRDNMLIRVDSVGIRPLPVAEVAETIDRLIASEPRPSAASAGPAPEIRTFTLSTDQTVRDGEIELEVVAVDPLGRDVMTKLIATGGELFRVDDRLIYRALQPGRQQLSVFAINETGLTASNIREVTVS